MHILFPSPVTYIDIGSMDIITGKADGAGNVVRMKAAVRNFTTETNLTVITEDGGFFSFDVHYAENPAVSTIDISALKQPAVENGSTQPEPASAGIITGSGPREARDRKAGTQRYLPPE